MEIVQRQDPKAIVLYVICFVRCLMNDGSLQRYVGDGFIYYGCYDEDCRPSPYQFCCIRDFCNYYNRNDSMIFQKLNSAPGRFLHSFSISTTCIIFFLLSFFALVPDFGEKIQ